MEQPPDQPPGSPQHLANLYTAAGRHLRAFGTGADAAAAMSQTAVDVIPGAAFAGMTLVDSQGGMKTVGATDPIVEEVDRIQYELGTGPCVDAIVHGRPFVAEDLRSGTRWPEFRRRAVDLGVLSLLSYRLCLEDGGAGIDIPQGTLNVYAAEPDAFDLDVALPLMSALVCYAALAVWGGTLAERTLNLEWGLQSRREIGIAIGILMERFKVTRDGAFGLLQVASQNANRKLRDIASHLAETGELPLPAPRRRPHERRPHPLRQR